MTLPNPKIFRYPLKVVDSQILELPRLARLLSVAPGRDTERYHIDLWALIPAEPIDKIKRRIWIFGTGHPLPHFVAGFGYVGTVVMPDALVWHVFYEGI